jgi:Tol biopolymer transport system component
VTARARSLVLQWVILAVVLVGPAAAQSPTPAPAAAADAGAEERRFLGRVRQLTFEGRRAGEGYFSPDGRKLVFQSEREPRNPFFQIYQLDFTTGDTTRVSPGWGKTTCAFFRPGTEEILFSSTHHDPRSRDAQRAELESRTAGKERRYGWDYDPEMEIYVARPGIAAPVRLTEALGYDAEASYSPDGTTIVFASNREAYAGKVFESADARRLETDPAYFADLYTMRADGTDVRRLTHTAGYDGGPFFLPDGKRILWRRFEENGLVADVWTASADGSDARRVTDFRSMSWAPYAHPSGSYIVFTSNKLGFENFELFVVDVEGKKEPVRITYSAGFDGLPVPSPDGKRIAWTSTRHGQEKGQIYLADWNHEAVVEALAAAPPRATAASSEGRP